MVKVPKFDSKMAIAAPSPFSLLQAATADLRWRSETDAAIVVLSWGQELKLPLNLADLYRLTGHRPDTPVQYLELGVWMAPALRSPPWPNPEEQAIRERFQALFDLLQTHLQEIQVYRFGRYTLDIYVIGQTTQGECLVLFTQAVET